MFKFMKSKKGFTLVELMIVVVIMAILVAVAVPIFSAVTANARKKTCATNRREIVSQLTTHAMSQSLTLDGTFTITSDGKTGDLTDANNGIKASLSTDSIKGLFQEMPYCPAKGAYTVTCEKGTGEEAGSVVVKVACSGGEDGTGAHA